MESLQDIVDRVRRLPPAEKRKLVELIEQETPPEDDEPETKEQEERRLASFDRVLVLVGAGQSDFTQVARNKHEHLAEIYADKHSPSAKQ